MDHRRRSRPRGPDRGTEPGVRTLCPRRCRRAPIEQRWRRAGPVIGGRARPNARRQSVGRGPRRWRARCPVRPGTTRRGGWCRMKSPARRRGALGALAVLGVGLASCSINAEGIPRDIPERDRGDLDTNSAQAGGAATGSGRIYLLSPEVPGQPRTLQPVARDVGNTPDDALSALFKGPNTQELQALMRSAIPNGTHLISSVAQNGQVLVVDVSNELQQLSGEALVDGVGQIVLTASEITGVSKISITIDGVPQQWPASNGELKSRPLTRYDFPGLVVSSQPQFPSVPSPPQPGT